MDNLHIIYLFTYYDSNITNKKIFKKYIIIIIIIIIIINCLFIYRTQNTAVQLHQTRQLTYRSIWKFCMN